MVSKKLTFKQTLFRHWLLTGLYTLGLLIVIFEMTERIVGVPWRYYRYWQTTGVYLLVLTGYLVLICLSFLLLRRSAWWRLLFIPSFLYFLVVVLSDPVLKNDAVTVVICHSHLKAIAIACKQYSEEFGVFPDSLEQLRDLGRIDANDLTCAANRWHNPGDIDYLYFGKGVRKSEADPDKVLARDKPEFHSSPRRRSHALFDFSVSSD
ncbi:MAG: hypothetical protein IJS14_04560 [Lentisphaeria bacterium]|nr:hypothetical protein [Lentisphaeria bacterium]